MPKSKVSHNTNFDKLFMSAPLDVREAILKRLDDIGETIRKRGLLGDLKFP
jgi:hypothetical protein